MASRPNIRSSNGGYCQWPGTVVQVNAPIMFAGDVAIIFITVHGGNADLVVSSDQGFGLVGTPLHNGTVSVFAFTFTAEGFVPQGSHWSFSMTNNLGPNAADALCHIVCVAGGSQGQPIYAAAAVGGAGGANWFSPAGSSPGNALAVVCFGGDVNNSLFTLLGASFATGGSFAGLSNVIGYLNADGVVPSVQAVVNNGVGGPGGTAMFVIQAPLPPDVPSSIQIIGDGGTGTPVDRLLRMTFDLNDPDTPPEQLQHEAWLSYDNGSSWPVKLWSYRYDVPDYSAQSLSESAAARVQIRTKDPEGNVSGYGLSPAFTIRHAPSSPAWTQPAAGAVFTIGRQYTLRWTLGTDPNNTPSQLTTEIQISVNNKATWLALTTTAGGATAYATDWAGRGATTTLWLRQRTVDPNGNSSAWVELGPMTLRVDVPPGAPSNLLPATGSVINRLVNNDFTFTYNDDPSDPPSQARLKYSNDGGATFTTVTTAGPFPELPTIRMVLPAGSLTRGTNRLWKADTTDQAGHLSAESAVQSIRAGEKPGLATFIAPGPVNNGVVGVVRPTIYWQNVAGVIQAAFELQNLDGAGVQRWTSGVQPTANTNYILGIDQPNGTQQQYRIRVQNDEGLWSDWQTITVTIAYAAPAKPAVLATPIDSTVLTTGGYIAVAPQIPAPAAGQPVTSYVRIYRRRLGRSVTETQLIQDNWPIPDVYNDYGAAHGELTYYSVDAVAGNGEVTRSDEAAATLNLRFLHVHDPDDPGGTIIKLMALGQDGDLDYGGVDLEPVGSNFPVTVFGAMNRRNERAQMSLMINTDTYKKLLTLLARKKTLCWRDSDTPSNVIFGTIKAEQHQMTYGAHVVTITINQNRRTG